MKINLFVSFVLTMLACALPVHANSVGVGPCPDHDFSALPELTTEVKEGSLVVNVNSGTNAQALAECMGAHFEFISGKIDDLTEGAGIGSNSKMFTDLQEALANQKEAFEQLKTHLEAAGEVAGSAGGSSSMGSLISVVLIMLNVLTLLLVFWLFLSRTSRRAIGEMHTHLKNELLREFGGSERRLRDALAPAKVGSERPVAATSSPQSNTGELEKLKASLDQKEAEYAEGVKKIEELEEAGVDEPEFKSFKRSVASKRGEITKMKKKIAELEERDQ